MNEVQCLSGFSTADSFALAGRLLWPTHTQGVALGYKLRPYRACLRILE